ncbi:hypothetical protein [Cryptosporangium aurantiacum]|uniref:Uncharacterized protein n=1 Tax=Cryptosporangium aurantiacum TaxID=134849 RepID=A0A1M7MDM0_9ACTN|nr:hypothetical protein [Cryptosporangium aurantiacum]SHM88883.1 hypothetical protein SAMN05443668_10280 [Cryptosporangium aurantiacum]
MQPGDPTVRPDAQSRKNFLTLGVAVAALVLAALSLVIATLAFGRTGNRETTAAQQPLEPTAAASLPERSADTAAPVPSDDTSPLDPGRLEPSADYRLAYENQTLTVQSGGYGVEMDLDEPRVRPEKGSDGVYGTASGTGSFDFARAERVAPVQSAQASPGDCVEAIRSSASVTTMAAAAGLTVCILTSRGAAAGQGITQKVVRFHVDAVARDNDTLTVSLTAWNVP